MVALLGWKLFSLLIGKKSNSFLGLQRKQQSYRARKKLAAGSKCRHRQFFDDEFLLGRVHGGRQSTRRRTRL
jgi:hypothetical protein